VKTFFLPILYDEIFQLVQFLIIFWRFSIMEFTVYAHLPFKGIVSRDLDVCFLVSFDRSKVSTHAHCCNFPLKLRSFRVEFFDFRVSA
jgi:hypothetical protein